ncbi:MAG TPA: hypothetical protein DDY86_09290 [Syntrophaceae bacterium]|nr:hypothetical protein [Syntrophaceae bacterium]
MAIDYRQSPAYQRLMQRINRVRPENRAVLGPLIGDIDAKFAGESAQKELSSKEMTQNKAFADQSLGLRRESFLSDLGLRRRAFDEGARQNRIALPLGLGQVAAEYQFGEDREQVDMALLKKKMELMNRLPMIYGGE